MRLRPSMCAGRLHSSSQPVVASPGARQEPAHPYVNFPLLTHGVGGLCETIVLPRLSASLEAWQKGRRCRTVESAGPGAHTFEAERLCSSCLLHIRLCSKRGHHRVGRCCRTRKAVSLVILRPYCAQRMRHYSTSGAQTGLMTTTNPLNAARFHNTATQKIHCHRSEHPDNQQSLAEPTPAAHARKFCFATQCKPAPAASPCFARAQLQRAPLQAARMQPHLRY